MTATALPSIHRNGGFLPAAPLAAIIRRDITTAHTLHSNNDERQADTPGIFILASRTGISYKTLERVIKSAHDSVTLDFADRYCCVTGRHIRDVYPWLYTDEQIAADLEAANASELGVAVRHQAFCATTRREDCNCTPRYQAHIYYQGQRRARTFDRPEDARAWRQEWMVRA